MPLSLPHVTRVLALSLSQILHPILSRPSMVRPFTHPHGPHPCILGHGEVEMEPKGLGWG